MVPPVTDCFTVTCSLIAEGWEGGVVDSAGRRSDSIDFGFVVPNIALHTCPTVAYAF